MAINRVQELGKYCFGALLQHSKADIALIEFSLQFFQARAHEIVMAQGGSWIIGNHAENNKQPFLVNKRFLLGP